MAAVISLPVRRADDLCRLALAGRPLAPHCHAQPGRGTFAVHSRRGTSPVPGHRRPQMFPLSIDRLHVLTWVHGTNLSPARWSCKSPFQLKIYSVNCGINILRPKSHACTFLHCRRPGPRPWAHETVLGGIGRHPCNWFGAAVRAQSLLPAEKI